MSFDPLFWEAFTRLAGIAQWVSRPLGTALQARADAYAKLQLAQAEDKAAEIRADGQIRDAKKIATAERERRMLAIQASGEEVMEQWIAQRRVELASARTPALPAPTRDKATDVIDVEIVHEPSAMPQLLTIPDLDTRASERVSEREKRRQTNLENILADTYEELKRNPSNVADAGEVDLDWVSRFMAGAQDVSNEKMQQLWAQLLAGEVKRPGNFSPRSVEVLRNLTSQEAMLFAKLSTCAFGIGVIPADNLLLDSLGLPFNLMVQLQDAGLVNVSASVKWATFDGEKFESFYSTFPFCDTVAIVTGNKAKRTPHIDCYRLTSVGAELSKLVASTREFRVAWWLKEQLRHAGFSLRECDILGRDELGEPILGPPRELRLPSSDHNHRYRLHGEDLHSHSSP